MLIIAGACSEQQDWLELAKPNILDRMAAYEEEQIEFSILGLVRDPLPDLMKELAINVRSLEVINDRLMTSGGDADESFEGMQETVLGPEPSLGLTRAMIDEAIIPEGLSEERSLSSLITGRESLGKAQTGLRQRVREEQQSQNADDDHATGRRYDYGPAVRTWLRCLARKQQLAELLTF